MLSHHGLLKLLKRPHVGRAPHCHLARGELPWFVTGAGPPPPSSPPRVASASPSPRSASAPSHCSPRWATAPPTSASAVRPCRHRVGTPRRTGTGAWGTRWPTSWRASPTAGSSPCSAARCGRCCWACAMRTTPPSSRSRRAGADGSATGSCVGGARSCTRCSRGGAARPWARAATSPPRTSARSRRLYR